MSSINAVNKQLLCALPPTGNNPKRYNSKPILVSQHSNVISYLQGIILKAEVEVVTEEVIIAEEVVIVEEGATEGEAVTPLTSICNISETN